jgi:hypothetical protein
MWVVLLLLHLSSLTISIARRASLSSSYMGSDSTYKWGAISSCGCEERQHLSVLKVMSKKGAHRSTTKHETEVSKHITDCTEKNDPT